MNMHIVWLSVQMDKVFTADVRTVVSGSTISLSFGMTKMQPTNFNSLLYLVYLLFISQKGQRIQLKLLHLIRHTIHITENRLFQLVRVVVDKLEIFFFFRMGLTFLYFVSRLYQIL